MGVTSAIPTNLEVFATGVGAARVVCAGNVDSVIGQSNAMIGACGGAGVESTNLGSLSQLLANFAANEQYVATVHDELVAADHAGDTQATVGDGVVLAALVSGGLEQPPPLVSVQASEVFGVPPTSGFVDDPVCAANGNFVHVETDLHFPGFTAALNVQRVYNSLATGYPGAFGPGWTSLVDVGLSVVGDTEIRVRIPDGATVVFHPGGDRGEPWPANGRRDLSVVATAQGWDLVESPERRWHFAADGALSGGSLGAARLGVDRDGAVVTAIREGRSERSVTYRWDGVGGRRRIVEAISSDGRSVCYRYDGEGVLVAVSGLGGTASYDCDGALIVGLRDADGVELFRNVYDDTGRVLSQVSEFGRVTDYSYGPAGSTVLTDQFGVRNAMIHDRRGNLTSVVDTDGRAMRLTYDDRSRNTSVTDRDGNVWRYVFDDGTGDLIARIDPDGRQAEWTWDEQHRVVTETDRAGQVTTNVYDGDRRSPSKVINPDGGVATAVHDDFGYPVEITDPDGVITRFEWDHDGQLISALDALGGRTMLEFDDAGLYVRMLDAVGVETRVERDPSGRIIRHVVADGGTSSYRYTPAGRVEGGTEPGQLGWAARFGSHGKPVAITDGTGSTAEFGYDTNGNITTVAAPDGAIYRNVFDETGQLLDNIDPSGARWRRRRDPNGNIVEAVEPGGRRTVRTVDAWGRTLTSTAPDGATTTFTYHPAGGIATVTTPDGRRWSTEVDSCGRQTAVVDPSRRRSSIAYTPAGRIAHRRSPAGRTERFHYDPAGRVDAIDGIDGITRRIERDRRGRAVAIDDPTRGRVELTLTATGLVAAATDRDGTTRIERGDNGFIDAVIDPTGATTRYEWDPRGMLAAATDPAGATTSYQYDQRGRLATQTTPAGAVTSYGYNATGHLASVTDQASGTTTFERDPTGRYTGARHSDRSGWDATLDANGRVTQVTDPTGNLLASFGYDTAGRTTSATAGDGSTTTFLWDDNDDLIGVTTPGDRRSYVRDPDGVIVSETDNRGHRVDYVRDERGVIVEIVDSELGALAVPAPEPVERDLAGRIVARADGTAYRYDHAGRLAEVVPATGEPVTLRYDDNGLLASETTPTRVRRYAYDHAGRLTGIAQLPGGRYHYHYDTRGRRTSEQWPDGTTITYHWDPIGQLATITRTHPGGAVETTRIDTDATGKIVAVNGTEIGWDRARTNLPDRIGDRVYHHTDNITLPATDPDADPDNDSGTATGVTLTARGALAIGALVVLGARILDNHTRQFLSPDPLDPQPGTTGAASPYTYAWHDPINFIDPTGLRPISQAEFDEIRKREEQGKLGQAWEAIKEDPLGSALMFGAIAVGAGLCLTGVGTAIGAGILIGVATSAAFGVATGTFNPRVVLISGIAGAITGGTASAATSIPRAIAIGAAIEGGASIGTQLATGDHTINWTEVVVATGVGGATGGLTQRFFPRTANTPIGGATEGAGAGSETFYRGMSNAEYEGLSRSGGLSPRGESFVTQDLGYVEQLAARHPGSYEQIVQFEMQPGTRQALIDNGARDRVLSSTMDEAGLGGLPIIQKGSTTVVHVKGEGGAINFGLRPGSVDTFNCRILGFCGISGGG